ncbi:unnamed protein product, partial [Amoebophrya sp. A25]
MGKGEITSISDLPELADADRSTSSEEQVSGATATPDAGNHHASSSSASATVPSCSFAKSLWRRERRLFLFSGLCQLIVVFSQLSIPLLINSLLRSMEAPTSTEGENNDGEVVQLFF